MENGKNWREEIFPGYQAREDELRVRYNKSKTERREDLSNERRGGRNFASSFGFALKQTRDAEIAGAVYGLLEKIVDLPAAGTVSWEIRNLIRNNSGEPLRYGGSLREIVKNNPDLITGLDGLCERLKEYKDKAGK